MAIASPAHGAVSVTTDPALYPAFDEAITDYVTRCTTGAPVGVNITAAAGTTLDVNGQGARGGSYSTQVAIAPGQAFRMVATTGSDTQTYYVRCIPGDFPAWTFQRTGRPRAAWYAVAPANRTDFGSFPPGVSSNYVALFDANGVPVWWMKASHAPIDFSVLRNGDVAWTRSDATGDEEHLLDGSLVRVLSAVGAGIDIHELMLLGNGDYLLTAERTITAPVPCAGSDGPIADNGVQEVAPDGSLVWSWWASDHIPVSETPGVWCNTRQGAASDAYHINSAEPAASGFVISFRHLDALYAVDKASGSILWKLGGVPRPESLTVVGDSFPATDLFRGQHDARVLSDGTVTVHDNGFHPGAPRPPRAARYSIDTSTRTATLVEQKNDPGTVGTPLCCGSARKLPGGDWVMSWGSAGVITELGPSGERIFSLTFDDGLFSYRARPVPPGLISRAALRDGMDGQFQAIPVRPRGAAKVRVSLVPAFNPCASPDRTHGPPLGFSSCSAPVATSSFLTLGTPDANGAAANGTGAVDYRVILGDPSTTLNEADVRMRVRLTDVRRKADLTDYAGQLQVRAAVRLTDRLNGPSEGDSGTLDVQLPVAVPCKPTASATVGSTCTLSSTFDAIAPGAVVEGKRANWELGQVQVFDGGSSGTAGAADATLFETEGFFVP